MIIHMLRASTVQEMHLKVPTGLLPSGSSLVVKSNPLYIGDEQGVEVLMYRHNIEFMNVHFM